MQAASLPPPFPPAIMQCVAAAAREYNVPRILLLAIIKTESGGNVSSVNLNRNGSTDVGLMQINTIWAQKLESRYGIRNADHHIKTNYCYNIRVGAWVLRGELGDIKPGKDTANMEYWRRVGNYHSRTPHHNERYRNLVMRNLRWLLNNTKWY